MSFYEQKFTPLLKKKCILAVHTDIKWNKEENERTKMSEVPESEYEKKHSDIRSPVKNVFLVLRLAKVVPRCVPVNAQVITHWL